LEHVVELSELIAAIDAVAEEAESAVVAADDVTSLDAARQIAFGRKSKLSAIKRSMPDLPGDVKPQIGRRLGEVNARLEALLAAREAVLAEVAEAELLAAERLDLTLPGRRARHGHRHLVNRVIDDFVDTFVAMGYSVSSGPEVETDWFNFEALNFPEHHPARNTQDTLYVDTGVQPAHRRDETLLRTHTSPVQIRLMQSTEPPLYSIMPGRTFRRDTVDATHGAQFHQVEGLAIDRDITFADMAGTLEHFFHSFFGDGFDIRLFPDFFPFTEPSAGVEVWWQDRWLEIAGCGMVDPNVLRAVGYDPEQWQGFAFGFGVERIAMLRYGVDDIRLLFDNDLRVLEQYL
jgi:phenylalanyl-tRNA synthetase alpha chain